jgi:hypothetical protein
MQYEEVYFQSLKEEEPEEYRKINAIKKEK